jgi:parvulin-like peptidyl-prolyl isomerase
MAERSKPNQPADHSTGNPNSPRRVAASKLREERRQRTVLMVTGATIGFALLIVLGGVLYDQAWLPSRPVARVDTLNLSRADYWSERKLAYTQQIVQNFQLLFLLAGNPQFTQQFQGQSPGINREIASLRQAEPDDAVIQRWQDRQLRELGATAEGITVTQDEIAQVLVAELATIFLPDLEAIADEPAAAESATPAATAGPALTPTPIPSPTTRPTSTAAEATTQLDQIIDAVYRSYEVELAAVGDEPNLTKADFRSALLAQYRDQLIGDRLQEKLVPEDGFSFSEEPTRVQARQVLVAVAPGGDQEEAFAAARATADALVVELRGGADFATVAAAQSNDPGSREQGGDIGYFDRDGQADNGATYSPELVAAAFALDEGVISDPIRTSFGWHVIEVTAREVTAREVQLREARTEALDKWLEEQRARTTVARFPEQTPTSTTLPTIEAPTAVPTFLPGPPTPLPTPEPTVTATTTP